MIEAQSYPFAFHGAEPHDWFEPEGELFSYEICFLTAPDAAARRAVAEAWERALDPRAVAHAPPFLWAERWALVRVRPAGWHRAGVVDMARAVQRALTAVHGVQPIEQVGLAEALESDSDWDTWSQAARPEPAVGPRWPVDLPTAGGGARFAAACAEDADAEAARAAARAARSAEDDAPPAGGPVGDLDAGDAEDAEGEGGDAGDGPKVVEGSLQLARRKGADAPKPPEPPGNVRRLFGARANVALAPDGRVYGIAKQRGKPQTAGWLEEGELRVAEGGPLPGDYPNLGARDDGQAALFAFDEESVWEAVFTEGRVRQLFKHDESVSDIAYGPGERVLLLGSSSLDVYRRDGGGAVVEQRWSVDGYGMVPVRGGRMIFVKAYEEGTDGVTVFGFDGATLRRLARIQASVSELFGAGGGVFLEHYGDDGEETYEILEWSALLGELAANPAAFREVPVYTGEEPSDDDDDDDDDSSGEESDDDTSSSDDDEDSGDDDASEGDDGGESEQEEEEEQEEEDEEQGGDEDDDDDAESQAKRPEDYQVEPAPGRVGLLYLGRKRPFPARKRPAIAKEVRELFGGSREIEQSADGEIVHGWKKESRRSHRFLVVHRGHLVETPITSKSTSSLVTLSRDGRRALVPAEGDRKLWIVDLPEGKATLVWDFDKNEDSDEEIYSLAALDHGRVLAATYSELWIFSLAGGSPAVEACGSVDVRQIEPALDGRAVVLETSGDKPLRVWGALDGGLRVLAEFEMEPLSLEVDEGRFYVQGMGGNGWYEIVNIEDALQAARYDSAGAQYPRVELVKAPKVEDEEEDESEDEDEEEDASEDASEGGDGDDEDGDDDEESEDDEGEGDEEEEEDDE